MVTRGFTIPIPINSVVCAIDPVVIANKNVVMAKTNGNCCMPRYMYSFIPPTKLEAETSDILHIRN